MLLLEGGPARALQRVKLVREVAPGGVRRGGGRREERRPERQGLEKGETIDVSLRACKAYSEDLKVSAVVFLRSSLMRVSSCASAGVEYGVLARFRSCLGC